MITVRRHALGPVFCSNGITGRQRGMTLVELMVSIALALLVTLAAMGVLLFSRQSGAAMEQATALRDNARFSTELIRRVVLQAGFESAIENSSLRKRYGSISSGSDIPDIGGINNSLIAAGTDPAVATQGNRPSACGAMVDTRCLNGSDVLIVRHQGLTDGSMINCSGAKVDDALTQADRPMSAFHVRLSNSGEPALSCSLRQADGSFTEVELIEGVESFQVLYGVDGVTPNQPTTATNTPTLVTQYLRANEMVVAGQPDKTNENWRRVRAIRIGMILRGPVGSAIDNSKSHNLYPLGTSLANANDALSTFPTPLDGRLRQEVTFTVHLRNHQGMEGD